MTASSIVVQLGQCGTQLGHQLFETIYEDASLCPTGLPAFENEDYKSTSLETYFTETSKAQREAKSVMIDMEQKVVNQALQSATKDSNWSYPKGSQLCRKLGSGNNWSYGFQVHGPRCETTMLDLLHKEVEKCDRLSGFVVLMSLAGGTGSGLGSYVIQLLKDNFPNSVILNPTVVPFKAGEVAVQNYNAVFSLSSAFSDASGSILLKNDHLQNICSKSLLIDKISLSDLNEVASHQLASIFQPSADISNQTGTTSPYGNRDILFSIIKSSSCHSQYKLLNLRCLPHLAKKSVPFSTFTWSGLLRNMKQMLITNFFIDEGMNWQTRLHGGLPGSRVPFKSISNIVVLRGDGARTQSWNQLQDISDSRLYTSWLPETDRCRLWSVNRSFKSYEKSVSLLSNDSSSIEGLDLIVRKAWDMFSSKAYFHQYTKYGLEEEDFLNAYIKVDNIINSYRKLAVS